MTIGGGCLCGAVRFEADAPPIAARACWCRLCQYIGGGSGTVNVLFASDGFRLTGETATYSSVADSGTTMRRHFCPRCGTPLLSIAESRPHIMVVRAGTLDDPEIGRPESTIWASAAPSWACIDDAIPRIEGQPAPPPATE
ncbi:MAG: GFA family protein [Rhizorhabdus sp.]